MPSKDEKKLIQLGNVLALSVPKTWTDFWELHKGDVVTTYWNSILIVIPPGCEDSVELTEKIKRLLSEGHDVGGTK